MSKKSYSQVKGRGTGKERFIGFPHKVFYHKNFMSLSHRAQLMLFHLFGQYNGRNNGDLSASATIMKPYGWNSSSNRQLALKELEDAGFIIKSRQGGRNQCNLYAVTFRPVDYCSGKLDIPETDRPSHSWKRALFLCKKSA